MPADPSIRITFDYSQSAVAADQLTLFTDFRDPLPLSPLDYNDVPKLISARRVVQYYDTEGQFHSFVGSSMSAPYTSFHPGAATGNVPRLHNFHGAPVNEFATEPEVMGLVTGEGSATQKIAWHLSTPPFPHVDAYVQGSYEWRVWSDEPYTDAWLAQARNDVLRYYSAVQAWYTAVENTAITSAYYWRSDGLLVNIDSERPILLRDFRPYDLLTGRPLQILGSSFDDDLEGSVFDDDIEGGPGADALMGNGGADLFVLKDGDFVPGEAIEGGDGSDTVELAEAMEVDFSTGTLDSIEALDGSSASDDVTVTGEQWLAIDEINLAGGTSNVLTVSVAGALSSTDIPIIRNVEIGNLFGTNADNLITLTAAQLDAILIGDSASIRLFGGQDTIRLAATSARLNFVGATDASIQSLETVTAANAAAGVIVDLHGGRPRRLRSPAARSTTCSLPASEWTPFAQGPATTGSACTQAIS
jgi:hypothetical protein